MAKTKKTTTENEVKKPQIIEDGYYSMVLSKEEVVSAVQVLSFAKGVYEQMAIDCEKAGDTKGARTWLARAALSVLLYEKFKLAANIGEPAPGELH